MEFKDVLKKLRIDKGMSQARLADELGVTTSTVGMYETGRRKPSYEALEAIADYFNVPTDYLQGRSSESPHFTPEELDLILKYRTADEQTQRMVDYMLAYKEIKKGEKS